MLFDRVPRRVQSETYSALAFIEKSAENSVFSLKIWLMPSAPRSEPPFRESRISAFKAAEEK